MRWLSSGIVAACLGALAGAADDRRGDFTRVRSATDKPPAVWKADHTGVGTGSVWQVVDDDTAPSGCGRVLAQTAASPRGFFNVYVAEDNNYLDVEISVAVKAVRGTYRQGGGLVWRYRDSDHYYAANVDPRAGNVRLYKVLDGRCIELGTKDDLDIPQDTWYTLKIEMHGDHIEGYLNDRKQLDVRDLTLQRAGKVGLWTQADARSRFDRLRVASGAPEQRLDAVVIGRAAAARPTVTKEGVVRISWPRTDVAVRVDGLRLQPFAGLGSWAAFTPARHGAMVMGDTVVFQDEVDAAVDAAFAGGLEVTGLHNHFFYDEPKVYFMHIGGRGEPEKLAGAVKGVWDAIKKVRAKQATPAKAFPGPVPQGGKLTKTAIERMLGHAGEAQQGVVKVTIGREGEMHDVKVGGAMGLTTWAAFSGGDDLAAVDGDFIMTAAEVQPVLRALRRAGIHVVALHNHMVGERPPFYFTHFWGKGPAKKLASGVRGALDAQKAPRNTEEH
jgi:hypothetical protein